MNLTDGDAALYRLYAVGLLNYEEALRQAQSVSRLRRALLEFDQNARLRPEQVLSASTPPAAGSRPASSGA
jgi:Tfp pilus assembly ATPase PilU